MRPTFQIRANFLNKQFENCSIYYCRLADFLQENDHVGRWKLILSVFIDDIGSFSSKKKILQKTFSPFPTLAACPNTLAYLLRSHFSSPLRTN